MPVFVCVKHKGAVTSTVNVGCEAIIFELPSHEMKEILTQYILAQGMICPHLVGDSCVMQVDVVAFG